MVNREKVIKGLEVCKKTDCSNCPYNLEAGISNERVCIIDDLVSDVLALLKEQEDEIKELRSIVEFWKEKAFAGDNNIPLKW